MFLRYYQKLDDTISYLFSSNINEKKLLQKIFKKKKIVLVDIGANEGNYIDLISKNLKIKKIFCFEPIKELSDKIHNRYSDNNLIISNLALSNKKSKRNFYQYSISSTSSLYKQNNLYKSLKKLQNIKKIQTSTFDNIFKKNLKIDICKIDVQGEDYKVIIGMKNNLKKKNIRILKIELSLEKFYEKTESNFYEILFFLKRLNYQLISISKIKYKDEKITFMDAYFEYKK